jgi:hypothetical protein
MPRRQPRHRTLTALGFALAVVTLLSGCAASSRLSFDSDAGASPFPDAPGEPLVNTDWPIGDAGRPGVTDETVVAGDHAGDAGDAGPKDPQATIEAELSALVANWQTCFHEPADCDPAAITAPDSPERARLTEAAAYYTAERISTRPGEGTLEWDIEALTFADGNRARIMVCEYDTRVFFDVSMADTPLGDIIFDTTIWTRRVEWTLARVDGSWTLWSRYVDRRSPVARFCTP